MHILYLLYPVSKIKIKADSGVLVDCAIEKVQLSFSCALRWHRIGEGFMSVPYNLKSQ